MSQIITIADAVVASLNEASFNPEFTAQRLYQPIFELSDMQTLHVSVVPRSETISGASRSEEYFDHAIDIGVQKKLDTTGLDEIDALMDLVEQIVDHLRHRRLAEEPTATWMSIKRDPVFVVEHLDQLRQFTGVLTVTYRMRR